MLPQLLHSNPLLIWNQAGPQHAGKQALFNTPTTRHLEQAAQAQLPPHTLMQRAGLAVARLGLALSPHSQTIWLACGPGNNGGDGLEAAMHLKQWGKTPVVTWLGDSIADAAKLPADAARSRQRAIDAGVTFANEPPDRFDLGIDAILGLGARTDAAPLCARMAQWIGQLNQSSKPVVAVDLPTGLNADTGDLAQHAVRASATLSLLTLKPGLFTASGHDHSGDIWLSNLGVSAPPEPDAWLSGPPPLRFRAHTSHKGTFGDVLIVGGAPGMTGAALLAAGAALHFGAGRVFVSLLKCADADSEKQTLGVHQAQPELMFRRLEALCLKAMTVVCGCGGGNEMYTPLAHILQSDAHAVIDADGLNAIAVNAELQALLNGRAARGLHTILTPHPLEAARLLETTTQAVQRNRIAAAQTLADQWRCTVALKGSGTVVATHGQVPSINPTGNARLATAGTGDVLAGMVGACMARYAGQSKIDGLAFVKVAHQAACDAVFSHGQTADNWPEGFTLTASGLVERLRI